MAAGLRLEFDKFELFRERFHALGVHAVEGARRVAELCVDAETPLSIFNVGLIEWIERLEPFGLTNPSPVFLATELELVGEPKRIGGGERHLSFRVSQGGRAYRAVAWGMGERLEEIASASAGCCAVFRPMINEYQGFRSVELEVKDFRATPKVDDLTVIG
jgi:single-stranded-DNA-specific exonuclease